MIDQLTVLQTAGGPATLKVILIGMCVTLPVNTGFSCRVFRGKTIELAHA
ncbi:MULTISPECIES: hypothetical protein [unclassified Bradyrhizobium]|nr:MULTISPECIES: hypothetical protein [unclassified Bradyrhizobium]QIG94838.1 hypothetical protein G6P99_22100 [Bradyrhizobium sp. 6(2017)]